MAENDIAYIRLMSKRALKKYLDELSKPALEEQLLDLYERFGVVKKYYNFVFNPKEEELIGEAKQKISNEYFPVKRKRPRARRSVAQKYIRQFIGLGMDPSRLADLMLYNLEVAQVFEADRRVPEVFYKSMLNSYKEALQHIAFHKLLAAYKSRIVSIYETTQQREWPYSESFSRALDLLE